MDKDTTTLESNVSYIINDKTYIDSETAYKINSNSTIDSEASYKIINNSNIDSEVAYKINSNSIIDSEVAYKINGNTAINAEVNIGSYEKIIDKLELYGSVYYKESGTDSFSLEAIANVYTIILNPGDITPEPKPDNISFIVKLTKSVIKIISTNPEFTKEDIRTAFYDEYMKLKDELCSVPINQREFHDMIKYTSKSDTFLYNFMDKGMTATEDKLRRMAVKRLEDLYPFLKIVEEDWYFGARTITFDSKTLYETETLKRIVSSFADTVLTNTVKLKMTRARLIKRKDNDYAVNIDMVRPDSRICINMNYDIKIFIADTIEDFNYDRQKIHIIDADIYQANRINNIDKLTIKYCVLDIE